MDNCKNMNMMTILKKILPVALILLVAMAGCKKEKFDFDSLHRWHVLDLCC